ncbi:hypothetical protein, conserved [Eimeria tenella]|uniref:RecQ mediated genome instability protein 1 OB-fold domain-containing protein n=1 Tax=Eimeria tenella TaxID=5802 RepID=U6LC52_EIMTE|nr:hypothetical protein, conserved [Eimeria tenella]CDJ45330.1 hypothetical protein, conserved [Eimeria tenella]|eukprot:XP_013236076.1 hypothetical protein, conserved [Eimeria tenella]
MMEAAAIQGALVPWALDFTPEGFAAIEQSGASSPAAVKDYVLSADLRRLHLAPHPADPTNFSALHSKSMQAPPEVAACAAIDGPAENVKSTATNYTLRRPLLCMVLSFQDVRLPTKDVEEDFSDGAQGIKGNQRRLLSLKLTDGRGTSFTAVELRFCQQLDIVPLLPGVKLLLLPGLVFYRGMALLTPRYLQNLAGGAKQLREAFNLKADVQERRKLLQQILNEHTELQQRVKSDKGDTGPPKFVPFSFAAKVQQVEINTSVITGAHQKTTNPSRKEMKRETASPTEMSNDTRAGQPTRSLDIKTDATELKRDRLRQLEKVDPNSLGAEKISTERKTARGGRGRRGRRERDDDLSEYMKPSGRQVAYNLLDLIKADAEQTNSAAATAILCANEQYVGDHNFEDSVRQPNAGLLNPTVGLGDSLSSGAVFMGARRSVDTPRNSPPSHICGGRSRRGGYPRRGSGGGRRVRGTGSSPK